MPLCTADSVLDMIAPAGRMQGCWDAGLLSTRCQRCSQVLSPCSSAHSALAASAVFLALGCLAGAATDLACTCTCCAALDGRDFLVRTCSAAFKACHAVKQLVTLMFDVHKVKHTKHLPLQSSNAH